jgi:dTMP kinase
VLLDLPAEAGGPDAGLTARTESLLFAADRAEHVARVIRPALALGHVVITDRYMDSSVAYQGAGRDLLGSDIARLSRWATEGLVPDLTVVLDVPAADGLRRVETPDRLESEPLEFHERVRERFLDIAQRGGSRYLVVDATKPPAEVSAEIKERLRPMLPPSAAQLAAEAAERRAEDERRRIEEERRRLQEARDRAAAEERARVAAAEAARRHAEEEAALEERRKLAAAEAAEQARVDAARQAELQAQHDREEAERAARRAADAEARRSRRAAARAEREQARTARHTALDQGRHRDARHEPGRGAAGDPATREMSLTDELFGISDDDDASTADDRTVQLPTVHERRGDER